MRHVTVFLAALALMTGHAFAQTPAPRAPKPGEVESDPIKCWWKADRNAVRVGERFKLVLTCGVIETKTVKVTPVVNQLEPGAISLTPFEAVSGTRLEDVVVPPWRYLQYEYTMRILSEGFFGQDVNIPSLTVTYNLQAPGGGNEGRDQSYILPPIPMRVLSIVPKAIGDIRDETGLTFADVESRRFRANAALIAAGIAFAFAAVLAIVAVFHLAGRFRVRGSKAVRPLPASTMLRGVMGAMRQVRAEAARTGWTPQLMTRAVAALRIAGALALGRTVAQMDVTDREVERAGQLEIRTGMLRRRRVMLSASTTPSALLAELERPATSRGARRAALQQIAEALQAFSMASYGRGSEADSLALNNAIDHAAEAVRGLWLRSLVFAAPAQARRGPVTVRA